jgi:hypothetical protein
MGLIQTQYPEINIWQEEELEVCKTQKMTSNSYNYITKQINYHLQLYSSCKRHLLLKTI